LKSHGLKYYAALGDHELGDNPWRYPDALAHVAASKQAFREYLNMPQNSPDHMRGTAFYWTHGNVLFLTVDVFEPGQSDQGIIRPDVTGAQLAWMEQVIQTHPNADQVIVMGHATVLGPVRQWSSSGLMVTGGRESEFWQAMSRWKLPEYETSTERARPVFSENFKPLPRIHLDGQVDNH
jgi:hypothetical protein